MALVTSMKSQYVLMDAICKAYGIDPRNCGRIVIDIPCNDIMTVYAEFLGHPEKLKVSWDSVSPHIVRSDDTA